MIKISTRFARIAGVLVLSASWALGQGLHFRVLHFTVDGRDVEDYSIRFLVGKKVYTATRDKEVVYVPDEVQKAREAFIQVETGDDKFALGPFGGFGYMEGDEIKEDFDISITRHPELGCSRYVLRSVPTVRKGSPKLANIVDLVVNNQCAKAKPVSLLVKPLPAEERLAIRSRLAEMFELLRAEKYGEVFEFFVGGDEGTKEEFASDMRKRLGRVRAGAKDRYIEVDFKPAGYFALRDEYKHETTLVTGCLKVRTARGIKSYSGTMTAVRNGTNIWYFSALPTISSTVMADGPLPCSAPATEKK